MTWPIEARHRHTVPEAMERLDRLASRGAGPEAHDLAWPDDAKAASDSRAAGPGRAQRKGAAEA